MSTGTPPPPPSSSPIARPDVASDTPELPPDSTPQGAVRIDPAQGSVIQGKFLYQPPTWFQRLDPVAMFGAAAPLEVELGAGDGSFLIAWARQHPDRHFIGVERLLGRVRKVDRKSQRAGLENVRGLRIEASYCLEYLLPTGTVDAVHVYFPDPWPKRRHHKNRLVNERFPELARLALKPGGVIHLRTDNVEYFEQMTTVFGAAQGFTREEPPADLAAVITDFEREFLKQGIATQRASYRKA